MNDKPLNWSFAWLFVAAAWIALAGGGVSIPGLTTPGDAMVVMLYEADNGPLPPHAHGAAHDLVAAGREVRLTDDDELDGDGQVPEWLNPALEQGRAIMGSNQQDDALVLLSGGRVVKAVKLPASKEAILEAVK